MHMSSQRWCTGISDRHRPSMRMAHAYGHACAGTCAHAHARLRAYLARTQVRTRIMRAMRALGAHGHVRTRTWAHTPVRVCTYTRVRTHAYGCAAVKLHTCICVCHGSNGCHDQAGRLQRRRGGVAYAPPRRHCYRNVVRFAQLCDLGLFNLGRRGGMNPPPVRPPDLSGAIGAHSGSRVREQTYAAPSSRRRAAWGPIAVRRTAYAPVGAPLARRRAGMVRGLGRFPMLWGHRALLRCSAAHCSRSVDVPYHHRCPPRRSDQRTPAARVVRCLRVTVRLVISSSAGMDHLQVLTAPVAGACISQGFWARLRRPSDGFSPGSAGVR